MTSIRGSLFGFKWNVSPNFQRNAIGISANTLVYRLWRGVSMSEHTAKLIGSIAFVAVLLASGVGGGISANGALAADCVTAPNSPTPEGSHWYFRDRVKS